MSESRIVYCHPGADVYGSDLMAVETIRVLRTNGYSTIFVTPHAGALTEVVFNDGFETRTLDVPVLRKSLASVRGLASYALNSIRGLRRAVRFLSRQHASTVYVNTIVQPMWMIAARVARKSLIVHVREAEIASAKVVQFLLVAPLRFAHVIICNSESTQAFVLASLPKRMHGKVTVIVNGKDWQPYFRSDPPVPTREVRLLLVGRISPRKGQDVALRALGRLRERGVPATLTLVGSVFPGYEWFEEELGRLQSALGLAGHVEMAGYAADPGEYMERCDILLVPSRTEPFGTVALEGMAAKRLVIASRVGGLPEIVEDGVTGVLVPPGDSTALEDAILYAIGNAAQSRVITEQGFHRVSEHFSRERYEKRIVEVVRGLHDLRTK